MVSLLAALVDPKLFSRLIFIGASPRYLNDQDYLGGSLASGLGRALRCHVV
ncbi:MAG: hypothetical protein MUC60_12530 [Oscillatoria sp. Prado101]|jgi:sigma-B regulation protein RsbQ|nr:hypothetical protein [Oscillatoria sp. Prado101]